MTVPVVTALRARGRGRVAVELDGQPWRIVPLEAVFAAGLAVGGSLDRVAARAVGRELRRSAARGVGAAGAARARPHGGVARATARRARHPSRGAARDGRGRAAGGTRRRPPVRDAARRAARGRGAGDLLIADDLERHGVPADAVRAAIDALEPEATRVEAIVEARGSSPRTARYLAARGFSEASLETIIANLASDALG